MDESKLRNLIEEILREMVESPLDEDNLISDNIEDEVLDEEWTDEQTSEGNLQAKRYGN